MAQLSPQRLLIPLVLLANLVAIGFLISALLGPSDLPSLQDSADPQPAQTEPSDAPLSERPDVPPMAPPLDLDAAQIDAALAARPELPLDAAHTDVLMLMVCTFRKDRLQPYGQERPTTPFLLQLAQHGALFERTITQSAWTRPSMGSLLTGRWAGVLQLDDPGSRGSSRNALADGFTTIAEAMSQQGYHTIGASANPGVSSHFGFDQGFRTHHELSERWGKDDAPLGPSGAQIREQLLGSLDEVPSGQRVYLQSFFLDTHGPRRPSPEAVAAVDAPGVHSPRTVLNYDAALRTLDGYLGQLALEVLQRRPNLLVVVVGDHGEGLEWPEGHGISHGSQLFTTSTDVPFIWWHPALPEPGRRIGGLAMGVDLLPTLLDLLGLEAPEQLDGVSQAAALRGETRQASHTLAFSETQFMDAHKTAVVGLGHHLVRDHTIRRSDGPRWSRRKVSLYDLDEALEQTDLAEEKSELAARLVARLDAWEHGVSEEQERQGDPVRVNPHEEVLQQLEALGYVDVAGD